MITRRKATDRRGQRATRQLPDTKELFDRGLEHVERLRWRLRGSTAARRVLSRKAAAALLAVIAGLGVHHIVSSAERDRMTWGRTTSVLVTTASVPAGARLDGSNTSVVRRPADLIPPGALRGLHGSPRARVDLVAGEVVITNRTSDRSGGVNARLPDDAVGVTVGTGDLRPPVERGDRVDLFTGDVSGEGTGDPLSPLVTDAVRVASGAVVVDRTDTQATVAVDEDQAKAVAAAAMRGPVALVLVP